MKNMGAQLFDLGIAEMRRSSILRGRDKQPAVFEPIANLAAIERGEEDIAAGRTMTHFRESARARSTTE